MEAKKKMKLEKDYFLLVLLDCVAKGSVSFS